MPVKFKFTELASGGILCLGFAIFFGHHGSYWSAHWASKWAILIMGVAVWISFVMSRKAHFILGLTTAYLLLNALSVGVWPQNIYTTGYDPISMIVLEKNSLYAALILILSSIGFLHLISGKTWQKGAYATLSILPLASIMTTLLYFQSAKNDGFYSGNPSMNGCLIAALIPFTFSTPLAVLILIPVSLLAVAATQASIPLGVLAVSFGAFYLAYANPSAKVFIRIFLVILAVALIGYFSLGDDLLIDSGRFDVWREALQWHRGHGNFFVGTGLGTAQILVPTLQSAAHPERTHFQWFLWLHNDWLQVFFEAGIIGVALVVSSWFLFLKRSYRNPKLFASFCAFSAMALFNYPLRLPIHCFCLFLICCLIWQEDSVLRERAQFWEGIFKTLDKKDGTV